MDDDQPTQRVSADDKETVRGGQKNEVIFGRYELLGELGKGGMGVVNLALDRELGVKVALKFLREEMTSEADALKELKGEVVTNRSLAHPNIIKTHDFVTDGRVAAISMEYVSGSNLHKMKAERPGKFFDVDEVRQWVPMLCEAMHYAHQQKVVHRDIKPANLMINERGELKVGDFGIGRTVADTVNRVTKNAAGTPPFMSPQQTMGEKASPQDDVYSIGATIYDLLTGDPPFFRGAIREQALAKVPPSMAARRKELGRVGKPIPPEWEKAVASCLAKDAALRPPTARALRQMLEGQPVTEDGRDVAGGGGKPKGGFGKIALAAAVVALAIGGGAYWKMSQLPAEIQQLVNAGDVTAEEGALLKNALDNNFGAYEKDLAAELITKHTIQPIEWRKYSKQTTASDQAWKRLRRLLGSGNSAIHRGEESDWLHDALTDAKGKDEKNLAVQLVDEGTLTPDQWRAKTALGHAVVPVPPSNPTDPLLKKVVPLLDAGTITSTEAQRLRDEISNASGPDERKLAEDLLERKSLTVDQWRAKIQGVLPPPPKPEVVVDPLMAKIAPFVTDGKVTQEEGQWLRAALAGEKTDGEKSLADRLTTEKTLTPEQWRAQTALSYALKDDAVLSLDKLPLAIDLPVGSDSTKTMRLLLVPAGEYLRGSPAKEIGRPGNNSEPEPTPMKVPNAFYIGRYEVTQGEFVSVLPPPNINPSRWRYNKPNPIGRANWPIDSVDWKLVDPANKSSFIAVLNQTLAKKYGGTLVADLPSEDEWEYACRAGKQTAFNSGDNITSQYTDKALNPLAVYGLNPETGHPDVVGGEEGKRRQPNQWGLYDMHGNVAEWCADHYIRGGAWSSNAANCRAAWRGQGSIDSHPSNAEQLGFRLVLHYKPRD